MIAGKRPYTGTTLQELRRQHIQVIPTPLHEVVADVPSGFSDAIARATAKDRSDRQSTAGELSTQLRSTLETSQGRQGFIEPSRGDAVVAQTLDIGSGRGTSSDVDAPTIITVDASAGVGQNTAPSIPVIEKPLPPATEFELPLSQPDYVSAPTVVEKADMASSVTIPRAPKTRAPSPARGKAAILIGVGVVVLLLFISAGGFVAYKWLNKPADAGGAASSNTATGSKGAESSLAEVGRYWLEVEPRPGAEPVRASGIEALDSGQSLKFHFVFDDDGYVYIVGPGQGNQPTAFLTAKPPEQSGLKDNKIRGGADLSFPRGSRNWLTLDKNPGTETYTIIFSPSPEPLPAFLNQEFTGTPLNPSEQQELAGFLAKYKESKAVTELRANNGEIPFVAVKASGKASDNPIILEIRIQHK
jgi:hypothetical protein